MRMLIMTTAQAEAVRGPTSPGHALNPTLLADGAWALPVDVIDDPAHMVVHGLISDLPRREVAPGEYLAPEEED